MFTRDVLRLGMVASGCAALVLVLGGCASSQGGGRTEGGAIPQAINKDLSKGYSLSEVQALSPRDRKIYEAERYNDIYPEHKGTNGSYVKTPGDENQIWHWGN